MTNLINFLLSLIAVIMSVAWVVEASGYEPKIAVITCLVAFVVTSKKIFTESTLSDNKYLNKFKGMFVYVDDSSNNTLSSNELIRLIKKHDYYLYKANTLYSPILITIIFFILTFLSVSHFHDTLDGYDKYLKGVELSESQKKFNYEGFNGEGPPTREQFVKERKQALVAGVLIFTFMAYIIIKPFIAKRIYSNLVEVTKNIYNREDFKEFSHEVNDKLKTYDFLNSEVKLLVIQNFTRVYKECFLVNITNENS